jgi:DNA-binding SARP family transcriptional activator
MLALELLGPVVLRRNGAALPLTIRKTAAVLVLLALGGPMPRARVAALLWPDLEEALGRRNLRRELARLREAGAPDAVQADGDRLALAPTLALDTHSFRHALQAGDAASALAHWRGPPADGLDLDDAQPFMDWLGPERDRLQAQRRQALQAAVGAAQTRGDTDTALALLRQLLADDPLQEQHHRAVMQLLASSGRREAALAQYRRCCDLLRDELGLVPMAETEALAGALRGQPAMPAAVPVTAPGRLLPAALPFVGRQAEVLALEAAWHSGAAVLVEGLAGVGKTRLALDVAAAHGAFALVRCQPGDAELPYAAFARALQCLCGQAPDRTALAVAGLALWAIDELARLLPGLGAPPPAIRSAEEQARFFEACLQAWRKLAAGSFDVVVLDDWHLADSASLSLLIQVVQQRRESGTDGTREWLLMRPEVAAATRQRLCDGLQAVTVPLQPLDDAAVLDLVRHLSGAQQPVRFAARLQRATGGNPFFIAETLRLLAETGALYRDAEGRWSTPFDAATEDYHELPLPPSVRAAVLARVQRLPDAARRLLEAASLAAEPFAPVLLAAACALSELEATAALEQALDAMLVQELAGGGHGFSHDLARQALAADLSPQRRRLVHRRLALAAEATRAPPALTAQQFEAAGDAVRAAPFRLAAGDEAQRLFDSALALQHWQAALAAPADAALRAKLLPRCAQAQVDLGDAEGADTSLAELDALLRAGQLDPEQHAEAVIACADLEATLDRSAEALARIETLLAGPGAGRSSARARRVRSRALQNLGRLDDAQAGAELALQQVGADAAERAALLDQLLLIEYQRGRPQQALVLAREAVGLWQALGDRRNIAKGHFRTGTMLLISGEVDAGALELERARRLAAELHLVEQQRDVIVNLLKLHADRGDGAAMLALAEEGWQLAPGFPRPRTRQLLMQARLHARLLLGELGTALTLADQVLAEAEAAGEPGALQYAVITVLDLLAYLGDFERGRRLMDRLLGAGTQELAFLGVKLALLRAFLESRAGDTAAARQALASIAEPQALQQPQDRVDLALREAEIQLAEGAPAAALATLSPWLQDVPSLQLQAMVWMLHLRAALALGPVPAADRLRAQALLDAGGVPPLEALDLLRALALTADDPAGPLAAQAAADRLAASLADWPAQQRYLRSGG